jgi:hypothetical protein
MPVGVETFTGAQARPKIKAVVESAIKLRPVNVTTTFPEVENLVDVVTLNNTDPSNLIYA